MANFPLCPTSLFPKGSGTYSDFFTSFPCYLCASPPFFSCHRMHNAKFPSQRRKKRNFYGNRITSGRNDKSEHCEDERDDSAVLEDEIDGSNTEVDNNTKVPALSATSASFRKLKEDTDEKKPQDQMDKPETCKASSAPMITGFRLFDMEVLSDVVSILRCYECGESSLMFMEDEMNRKGCTSSSRLLCENCGWKASFYTSKQQGKSFEVNRRIVYSMRTL